MLFLKLQFKKLNKEDEYKYIKMYQDTQCSDALLQLLHGQYPWALKSVTKIFQSRNLLVCDDMTAVAYLTVIMAVKSFNFDRNVRLSTVISFALTKS